MVRGNKIYHCHGKNKGKVLGTYSSHAKALQVHRAIMANRNRLVRKHRRRKKHVKS